MSGTGFCAPESTTRSQLTKRRVDLRRIRPNEWAAITPAEPLNLGYSDRGGDERRASLDDDRQQATRASWCHEEHRRGNACVRSGCLRGVEPGRLHRSLPKGGEARGNWCDYIGSRSSCSTYELASDRFGLSITACRCCASRCPAGAYNGSLSELQVDGAYDPENPPYLLQLQGSRFEMG